MFQSAPLLDLVSDDSQPVLEQFDHFVNIVLDTLQLHFHPPFVLLHGLVTFMGSLIFAIRTPPAATGKTVTFGKTRISALTVSTVSNPEVTGSVVQIIDPITIPSIYSSTLPVTIRSLSTMPTNLTGSQIS